MLLHVHTRNLVSFALPGRHLGVAGAGVIRIQDNTRFRRGSHQMSGIAALRDGTLGRYLFRARGVLVFRVLESRVSDL